jgi:hypothetical protein
VTVNTDVGGSAGDDAVEGGGDALEGFERLQPLDIGARGCDQGGLGGEVAVLVVGVLARDRVLGQQPGPAPRRDLGEVLVGDGGGKIGLGLEQLLVEIRRVDLGEQLPRPYRRADIRVPALEVAADPGMDRRVVEGADIARQHERARLGFGAQGDQLDGRNRLRVGPGLEILVGVDAADDAECDDPGRHAQGCQTDRLEVPWRPIPQDLRRLKHRFLLDATGILRYRRPVPRRICRHGRC